MAMPKNASTCTPHSREHEQQKETIDGDFLRQQALGGGGNRPDQIDENRGASQGIDDGEEGGHDQDGGLNDRGYFLTDVDHWRGFSRRTTCSESYYLAAGGGLGIAGR